MPLKNHYAVLGVPQSATAQEIRKAFRELAKKYHPDKAHDNPFAVAHFTEIQEAYEVLSNSGRRIAYDEERWLRGLSTRTYAAIRITPEWILGEAARLRKHMAAVDTYRMNHAALRDYIAALISPEHLGMLHGAPELHAQIIEEIIAATAKLRRPYINDVAAQLLLLAGNDAMHKLRIMQWMASRSREAKWDDYRPLIVILFALLICLLIWWLS